MNNKQDLKSKSLTNLPSISVLGVNSLNANKIIKGSRIVQNLTKKDQKSYYQPNKTISSNLEISTKLLNPNITNEYLILNLSQKEGDDQIPQIIYQQLKQFASPRNPINSEARYMEKVSQMDRLQLTQDISSNVSQNFQKFLNCPDSMIYINSKEAMVRMRKTNSNNISEKLNKLWIQDKKKFQTSLVEIQRKTNESNFNQSSKNNTASIIVQDPEFQRKYKLISKNNIEENPSQNNFMKKNAHTTSRQEVIELEEWMNLMIQNAKKQNTDKKDVSIQIQLIHSVCIKELIQQCSQECNERGKLLGRIWGYYIDLLQQITQQQEDGFEATEQQSLDEVTRLHKTYGQMVELLRQEVKKVKYEGEEAKQLSEQLIQTNQFLKNKLLQSNGEIKHLLLNLDDLKHENEKLMKEIIDSRTINPSYMGSNSQLIINNQSDTRQRESYSGSSKSIVQHILSFKQSLLMRERPNVEKQHVSQMQVYEKLQKNEKQLKEELLDRGIISYEEMNKSIYGKNLIYSDNMDVVQTETQTDPMIFSENPQVNQLLYSLADCKQFLDPNILDQNKNDQDVYAEAIRKIEENHYISHEDKDFFIKIIKQALNQVIIYLNKNFTKLHNYQILVNNFSQVNDQYAKTKKKAITNLIELKEQQQLVDELKQDLVGTSKLIESLQQVKKVLTKSKTLNSIQISSKFSQIIRRASLGIYLAQKRDSLLPNKRSHFAGMPRASIEIQLNTQNLDDIKVDEQKSQKTSQKHSIINSNENISPNINQEEEVEVESFSDEEKDEFVNIQEEPKIDIRTFEQYLKFKEQRILKEKTKRYSQFSKFEHKTTKIQRQFSQNTESANQILNYIVEKNLNRSFKKNKRENISLNQIVKIVNNVFNEALKTEDGYRIPLHVAIYDFLINRYGFKQVAEKKHKQILSYIARHQNDNYKLTILAQLCHLVGSIDQQAYKLFLISYQRLCIKVKTENQMVIGIPLEQVNDYIQHFLSNKLDQKQLQGLQLRTKQISKSNHVDFDQLMISIIHIYQTKKEENQKFLKVIFEAVDLNGNNLIEFYEFKLIFRLVYAQKFNKQQILKIFINYADIYDEHTKDKMMTLQRFAEMAFEQNLFKREQILILEQGYENLKQIWDEEKDTIKYRFLVANKFNKVKYTYELLSNFINDDKSTTTSSQQSLQIGYKLIETKSKEVILKHQIQEIFYELIPTDILWIQESYKVYKEFEL